MKKVLLFILLSVVATHTSIAGVADDGVISDGEYDYGVVTLNNQNLLVIGGGASTIEARGSSILEVRSTSPLSNTGGIMDILLVNNSELLYSGGEAGLISIGNLSTAVISGGTINMIRSYQMVGVSPYITIKCKPNWSWLYTSDKKTGITGQWVDDTIFSINFLDQTDSGYDPVWKNIKIVEIPEPTTLALLGLGGLLIRRKN